MSEKNWQLQHFGILNFKQVGGMDCGTVMTELGNRSGLLNESHPKIFKQ